MNLGTYTGIVSRTGTVTGTLSCIIGTPYTLGLSKGTGAGATTTNRLMTSGSSTLPYQLYQDANRSTNWGNIGGTGTLAGTGSSAAVNFSVVPQILAGQTSPPGTYIDTITASASDIGIHTTAFTVTAIILPTCTISATNLGFGTYFGNLLTATSTLTATCTSNTPYNVGLDTGRGNPYGTRSTVTTRNMQGGDSNGLNYSLFRDSSRTLNWGNTVGTDTLAGTGSGFTQMLTVYGQVAPGQHIAPGNYVDTVIVTLSY